MTSTLSPSNLDRAAWADEAVQTFRKRTGSDLEDSLADLLTDLMHWADGRNIEFRSELDRASMHYEAEIAEEEAEKAGAL